MTNPDLVSIPSGVTPTLYLLDLTIPGAGTALLGKEGAMACTVAVEESIAHHYNNQIRTLMEKEPEKYEELLQVSDHALKGLPGAGGRADSCTETNLRYLIFLPNLHVTLCWYIFFFSVLFLAISPVAMSAPF